MAMNGESADLRYGLSHDVDMEWDNETELDSSPVFADITEIDMR